jgi:hypothetical protein
MIAGGGCQNTTTGSCWQSPSLSLLHAAFDCYYTPLFCSRSPRLFTHHLRDHVFQWPLLSNNAIFVFLPGFYFFCLLAINRISFVG